MTMVKVEYGAWVLVGDGKKALLLLNEGDPEILNLRRIDVSEQDNPPSRLQGTDAPGRGVSAGTGTRFGAMGETDWHQMEEDRFAATVAARMNHAAEAHAFKSLIVVAPPKTLAELRRDFSPETRRRISAEIPKDLTHHPIPEIEKLLPSYEAA